MSDLKKLQRFLPVGALGISLILHLAIFLGISGIIIIQAVAPKVIPSGEYAPAGSASDIPPAPDEPDNQSDDPATLPDDAVMEAPPVPSFSVETISASAPTSAPSFAVAPPTSMMSSSSAENSPQQAPTPQKSANPNKTPGAPRSMANPFGNTNANPEDGGLVGYFYDFKQTKDRKPSGLAGDPAKQAEGNKLNGEAGDLE
ncbi:MAG: hypothetical protein LBD30_06360, partial [Verrucomicrobiales bacterium]|nr:hypothetical protein [Verrucomicrobiales bacterium]